MRASARTIPFARAIPNARLDRTIRTIQVPFPHSVTTLKRRVRTIEIPLLVRGAINENMQHPFSGTEIQGTWIKTQVTSKTKEDTPLRMEVEKRI